MAGEILYIHPYGHLNYFVVPAGTLGVINALGLPCRGMYSFEVRSRDIKAAKVVLMDCHWAIGLNGLARMASMIKGLNPGVRIVVGGITASAWAERLLANLRIDYIVQGDAEASTRALVTALVRGEEPGPIPNVWFRGGPRPEYREITREELDRVDTITCDWFPTHEAMSGMDSYPFSQARHIMASRGCVHRCRTCYGSYASSFGGRVVHRSPESTAAQILKAAEQGVPVLRLFFGFHPPRLVRRTLEILAETGVTFRGGVGFFICSHLDEETLGLLPRAFPGTLVTLSVVWPSEFESPGIPEERLARVEAEYADMGRWGGENPYVEYWFCRQETRQRIEPLLAGVPSRVAEAKIGYTWNMARPDEASGGLEQPVGDVQWQLTLALSRYSHTFQFARRLSPPMEDMLRIYGSMDDLLEDPELAPVPPGFEELWAESLGYWSKLGFPIMPRIQFMLTPFRWIGPGPMPSGSVPVKLAAGTWVPRGDGVPLKQDFDLRSPLLRGQLTGLSGADQGWVILPRNTDAPFPEPVLTGEVLAIPAQASYSGAGLAIRFQGDGLVFELQR